MGKAESQVVLVVAYDAIVRKLVRSALQLAGYPVLATGGPAEALAVLKQGYSIKLILTDVLMPGMDGLGLVREALAIQPDLRILFMSARPDNPLVLYAILPSGLLFLEKPFTSRQLVLSVRAALE